MVRTPIWPTASTGEFSTFMKIVPKSTELKVQKARRMPMVKPTSPMRVVMNAFLPASIADFRKK